MASAQGHTRVVRNWILEQQIGSGSFAVVWKARHELDNRLAAVKEINTERLSKKLQESLACEISVLEQIQHDNVVRLLDISQVSHTIYIVLEYCAGGDMGQYLRRKGRVTEATAKHFLLQLASGLKEIRQHNLIHRDLKPQNLLLSDTGREAKLKIADFGFARELAPQNLAETLCGSPLYMAPEILQFQKYDAKADLWSVGAILFELVTGRPPYTGANHVQLLRNIERFEVQIPDAIADQLSPSCKQLILELLRRNPVERISFEEFFMHPFLLGSSATPELRRLQPEPNPTAGVPDSDAKHDAATVQQGPSEQPPQATPSAAAQQLEREEPPGISPSLAALASRPLPPASVPPQRHTVAAPSLPVSTPASDRAPGTQPDNKDLQLSDTIEDEYVVVGTPLTTTPAPSHKPPHPTPGQQRTPLQPSPLQPARQRQDGHSRPPRPDVPPLKHPSSTALVCSASMAPPPAIDMPALLQRVLAVLQQLAEERRDAGAVQEAVSLLLLSVGVLDVLAGLCPAPAGSSAAAAAAARLTIAKHAKALQASICALHASGAPVGPHDLLPNSVELVYQAALLQCRTGGVEELMGNYIAGSSAYARAADLLLFLAFHFVELAAHPRAHTEALVACHQHVHKLSLLASCRRDNCAAHCQVLVYPR